MSAQNRISYVKFSEIDLSDTRYAYHYKKYEHNALLRSIKEAGVLTPVRLEQTASGYRVIHGFRRIECSKKLGKNEIPALISAQNAVSNLKLSLIENRVQGEFNLYEQSKTIHAAHDLGLSTSVIIEQILPLLGLNPHKNIYDSYRGFIFLPNPLIDFFVEKGTAISRTLTFQQLDEQGLNLAVEILEYLSPGINLLDEIMTHLYELSRKNDVPISDLADKLGLNDRLESGAPAHVLLSEIRQQLFEMRFPVLSETNADINSLTADLQLPHAQSIRWDKNLETRGVNVSFQWDTISDIRETIRSLSESENIDIFNKIFQKI